MKAFKPFYDLIVLFHRALADADRATLQRLLTADAAAQWATASDADKGVTLSDDIDVDGLAIEGNGALTVIRYSNRVERGAEVLELTLEVATIDGELRIAQPYPTLVRRITSPPC